MNAAVERSLEVTTLSRRMRRGALAPVAPNPLAALAPQLYAAHDPAGPRAEALKQLRAELILRWFGDCRTLAVLGGERRDGAGAVAANLAIALAQLGEHTLLIDADLRAPIQHELFGLAPAFGLVDLLYNRDVHEQALLPVPAVANLHVLCAGRVPVNPQELVSRTSFIYLMKRLPERFGAIVVTAPPALDYADAQVIAARARGCVLVTRRHRTRIADVLGIKRRLASGGAVLLGGVIQE